MVTAFAFVGITLFALTEFELEFDELVLLVWAILLPLVGFVGLIAPVIRESAEVRLYLVVMIVLPVALTYFYGSYYWPFDEAMLFALTLAPVVSLLRTLRASLKSQLPSYNRDFWKDRLPEIFLLLCVRPRVRKPLGRTACGLPPLTAWASVGHTVQPARPRKRSGRRVAAASPAPSPLRVSFAPKNAVGCPPPCPPSADTRPDDHRPLSRRTGGRAARRHHHHSWNVGV